MDEARQESRFYFTRSFSISVDGLDGRLASYRVPLGRLAEVPQGESIEIQLPNRPPTTYSVLERARIKPAKTVNGWDGLDARAEIGALAVSLISLLDFLSQVSSQPAEAADIFGALLAELEASRAVQQGVRRSIISRALRVSEWANFVIQCA